MARVLLGSSTAQGALAAVADKIASGFGLSSVEVELGWHSADEKRRAIPLIVGRQRAGTVLVPRETSKETIAALEDRVVPALEALVGAAQQREALEAQLIETETLRRSDVVKTTLLRSVSHDLHSPITAIAAAAETLAGEELGEADRRELVSIVSTESARLERLVRNLLDLSRLESGAARPRSDWVSVEEIVHAALAAARPPAGAFDVAVDRDVPLIRADAAQLERALANIADNAARYAGDAPVEVRARLAGPRVVVQIRDHGPGIPRDQLLRIFDPFHRVDDGTGGGSGLGLAIARGFVEANNGTVRVTSQPGGGSTFTVGLPVPREQQGHDRGPTAAETRA
jgi:two-component system sensor histidine kinase KdpD